MNNIKRIIFVLLPAVLCISCIEKEKPVSESADESKTMLMRKNLIGISGISSETPYVEIQHCVDDGTGKNIIKKVIVSPPYYFGDEFVNIVYDSITTYRGNAPINYSLLLQRDFSDGGAEYLRIINHSENNPIAFFIAGVQDVKTEDREWCRGRKSIEYLPSVYYKKAPIYYLIKPEAKYTKNLARNSFSCNDIFYFEGNRCGDLILDKAWDINDIAKLYKAEYNKSKDTILYVDDSGIAGGRRMIDAINYNKWGGNWLYNSRFYGIIPPGGKLVGDKQLGIIATDLILKEDFLWKQL